MNRQFGEAMMDSLGIRVEDTFSVGIDLEKAMAQPGSEYDLVLREGDVLSVPKLNNTVKVNGAVMMPNTVATSVTKTPTTTSTRPAAMPSMPRKARSSLFT